VTFKTSVLLFLPQNLCWRQFHVSHSFTHWLKRRSWLFLCVAVKSLAYGHGYKRGTFLSN